MRYLMLSLVLVSGFVHAMTLFTQPGCSPCEDARQALGQNCVGYKEITLTRHNSEDIHMTPTLKLDNGQKLVGSHEIAKYAETHNRCNKK